MGLGYDLGVVVVAVVAVAAAAAVVVVEIAVVVGALAGMGEDSWYEEND